MPLTIELININKNNSYTLITIIIHSPRLSDFIHYIRSYKYIYQYLTCSELINERAFDV